MKSWKNNFHKKCYHTLMPPLHSKILTASAREILRPIGMFQKGRSRIWLDDRSWWMCVVEFQSSSWAQGSYLNVGCMWLWNVKDHISFDIGHRVEGFSKFSDETQFVAVAKSLAERAATEVLRYRGLFPNVREASAYYSGSPLEPGWPTFNAAMVFALAGKTEAAKRLFEKVTSLNEDNRDWVAKMRADAAQLFKLAEDTARFRDVITERVSCVREAHKLPGLTTLSFD